MAYMGLPYAPASEPVVWQTLLPPGQHVLTITSRDHADVVVPVAVRAREVTDVRVALQPR